MGVHTRTHFHPSTIKLPSPCESIKKHLTPPELIPLLCFYSPVQPDCCFSLCVSTNTQRQQQAFCSARPKTMAELQEMETTMWGTRSRRKGFILLSDLECLTAGRLFFVALVCVCVEGAYGFEKLCWSQTVNSRAGGVSLRGEGCFKEYSIVIKQLFPLRLQWDGDLQQPVPG